VAIAFARLGADVTATSTAEEVLAADLAVLPGVGSAAAAMSGLRERGLDEALCRRVEAGRPTLGICLGLQLALDESEEDGGVPCLGLLPGRAVRLREGRVPRIGWAPVEPWGEDFYFAHSYAAETPAATAHSEGVVAEARAGAFIGVQFHPEKSGAAGARFLEQCLSRA
jgi:glutamine amidotransferase